MALADRFKISPGLHVSGRAAATLISIKGVGRPVALTLGAPAKGPTGFSFREAIEPRGIGMGTAGFEPAVPARSRTERTRLAS
jgi:hypothetical protein